MNAFLIFPGYFVWHYTIALRDIAHIWGNMLWLVNRQFSILLLLRTLFSPWRRVTEDKPEHFDLEMFAEVFVVNVMTRIVGAVMRIVIISVGLVFLLLTFIGGLVFFAVWLAAPALVITLFLSGLYYLA